MPVSHALSDTVLEGSISGTSAGQPVLDAVVIGAGIAGLTIAHRLKGGGNSTLILEASDRVGGAIKTHRDGDFLVECGPNSVLDTHPEVRELIEDVGLLEERIVASQAAKKRFIVRDGKLVAMPTSPPSLIGTSLFSLRAKLRIAAEPFRSRADPDKEETVAEFVCRRLGKEFLDYAIDPFVSGVYAGQPEHLSVRHAFPRLVEIEQRYGSLIMGQIRGALERKRRAEKPKAAAPMFSFARGLDRLPRELAQQLGETVMTGCRVTGFTRDRNVWAVQYSDVAGRQHSVHSRSVVYCGGLHKTDILKPLGTEAECLKDVYYPPLCVVTLGYRRKDVAHPLDGFGFLVPSIEKRKVLGALFVSTLFQGRAPEGHVLITVFVGGSRQPELTEGDDQEILQAAEADLKDLLGAHGRPVFHHVSRWPAAIPQYTIGYGHVKNALTTLEKRHPGLFFAGNYRSGISVPDTIHHSSEISESIGKFIVAQPTTSR